MAKRQLAAIMFTDIVGYSAIMQRDENYGKLVRDRHKSVFEETNKQHEGQIIQYFGDGTLSIFPSAVAAVECAIELQRKFHQDPAVPIRIGIHTGDITFDKEEAYGHGMNVAARIEPICVPGGIFISERVYDDIRNHRWITAQSLGPYQLKNIRNEIEIYAITNDGVDQPDFNIHLDSFSQKEAPDRKVDLTPKKGRKKKTVAGFLALFLGIFGMHRFYIGGWLNQLVGFVMLAVALVGMFTEIEFMVAIPAIIGFLESILFFVMPKADFDNKYNLGAVKKESRKEMKRKALEEAKEQSERRSKEQSEMDLGYSKMSRRNYESAIEDFEFILDQDPGNTEALMAIAMCYSMLENADQGFFYLSEAVKNGYSDFQRIDNHFSLAYLRSRKEYATFKDNGYRNVKLLPAAQEDLLQSERPLLLKKLEQIEHLGQLKEDGILTEEEFLLKKKEILKD